MNVLHLLVGGEIGGIESLCRDYAYFSKHNNVFVMLKGMNASNAKDMISHGHKVIQLDLKTRILAEGISKLAKIIKDNNIEVIITHHASPILHIMMHAMKFYKKDIKCYSYAHGTALNMMRYKEKKGLLLRKIVLSLSLRKSDAVFAISRYVANTIVNEFKVPKESIKIIYNGVNTARFQRVRKSLPSSETKIIYVGRLIEGKGVQIILEALKKLPQNIEYKFYIVGNGSYKNNLENICEQYCLNQHVEFLGSRDNVEDFIQKSDIFIHVPILEEGFGITIVEAMAGGLICIGSESGGIPEIIDDQINGYLVPKCDSDALAEKLKSVIQELPSNIIEKMIYEAQKKAKHFDIIIYAQELDNFISKGNR